MLRKINVLMSAVVAALAVNTVRAADSPDKTPITRVIHIAIYHDAGSPDLSSQVVDNALKISPSFVTKRVDAQEIRDGALSGMDALVQPGGSGSAQAKALQPDGCEKIKTFVKNGGGFVGICAGSYLASSYYPWSLHILNADVVDAKHWARGKGDVQLKFSDIGQKMLGLDQDQIECLYHQGPLMGPGSEQGLAPYEPIATFGTEVHTEKSGAPVGIMIGTTAMARGMYGKGHVVAISPHPEKTDGLDNIVRRVVEWAATGEVGKIHAPTTRPITLAEATEAEKKD